MADQNQSGMQCVEVEALLAEALDGSLQGATLAAFEAHQQSCPACRVMVEEAAAGMHWLQGLNEAEPPKHLVHNILAQTIGALPSEHQVVVPRGDGWWDRVKGKVAPIFAPVVTPRFAMSFGMAFFSITMLLGIAGFHVADLKRVDLSSKGIVKAYYSTQARVVRYYENIRLVYEIESRVRELRRVATPADKQDTAAPKDQQNPPKNDQKQEEERRNQNYNRGDGSQPVLAVAPAAKDAVKHEVSCQAMYEVTPQARLNRRTA